jgi:hypothetical protein
MWRKMSPAMLADFSRASSKPPKSDDSKQKHYNVSGIMPRKTFLNFQKKTIVLLLSLSGMCCVYLYRRCFTMKHLLCLWPVLYSENCQDITFEI